MSTWVSVVIAGALVVAGLELLRAHRATGWCARGIRWRARGGMGALLRLAPAAAGAAAVDARVGPAAATAVAGTVWLVVVAVDTDWASLKIPYEPCWATTAIGTLAGSWQPTAQSAVYLLAVAATVVLLYPAVRLGHLPAGDARLIVAVLAGTLWWAGTSCLPWALVVIAGWSAHHGWHMIVRSARPRPARPAAGWIAASLLLPPVIAILTGQTVPDVTAGTASLPASQA